MLGAYDSVSTKPISPIEPIKYANLVDTLYIRKDANLVDTDRASKAFCKENSRE